MGTIVWTAATPVARRVEARRVTAALLNHYLSVVRTSLGGTR